MSVAGNIFKGKGVCMLLYSCAADVTLVCVSVCATSMMDVLS